MRVNVAIGLLGLLAGLAIAFMVGFADRPAFGQVAGDGSMAMTATNYNNGQEDLLWVLDAKAKRLSCYKYKNNMVELIGARNVKYDLQVEEFTYTGKHVKPSVIKKELEQKQKEEEKRNK